MRGSTLQQGEILSTLTPDQLVPADHPIRRIRTIVDSALAELHGEFNVAVDFHGQRRRNDTHASTTDPEARQAKKSVGTAAKPSYAGRGAPR